MDEPELTQWRNEYKENAHYYRGKIIDVFNHLEKTIERYLIEYFSPKNKKQFQEIILDRLTFEAKRSSLKKILSLKATQSGFTKTKSNSWPDSELLHEIKYLNDIRVYFAHYYLVVPINFEESIVCLAEFRDELNFITYTINEYEFIINRMYAASIKISELCPPERLHE